MDVALVQENAMQLRVHDKEVSLNTNRADKTKVSRQTTSEKRRGTTELCFAQLQELQMGAAAWTDDRAQNHLRLYAAAVLAGDSYE